MGIEVGVRRASVLHIPFAAQSGGDMFVAKSSFARMIQPKSLLRLLLIIAFVPTYAMAKDGDDDERGHVADYPPFGSRVPTAHFDHGKRAQLTPPAPALLPDGRTAQSAWNMELVGYDTLDGRSTYQPFIMRQGDRVIAYMAHHAGTAINRLTGKSETNG